MSGFLLKMSVLAVSSLLILANCSAPGSAEPSTLKLTVVFNNVSYNQRLETAWGFACVIEGLQKNVLFDTGGNGRILLSNMKILDIDPAIIDLVVLSHFHGDHTNGLESFLRVNPGVTVYMPESFPDSFQASVGTLGADVIPVGGPLKIFDIVHTTGEMGSSIIEQSLILDTSKGLVVITGCAHPGIVDIVKKAGQLLDKEIYLVIGGFHLNQMTAEQVREIIREFKELGVKKVGPTHCTGDQAIALFRQAWGDDYVESGCGAVIELPR